jgi:hypothetical protein
MTPDAIPGTGAVQPAAAGAAPVPRGGDDHVGLGALFALTVLLVATLLAWPAGSDSLLVLTVATAAGIVAISWNVGAGTGPRVRELVAIAAIAAGVDTMLIAADSDLARGIAAALLVTVGIGAPIAVFAGLRRRRTMDLAVLFGAISIYLLVGIGFAMAYSTLSVVRDEALFMTPSGPGDGLLQDRVYYSFITLSTTGYGDITPLDSATRALAVLEAIGGQLYLVIALTSVVSVLLSRRQDERPVPRATDPAAASASRRTPRR